MNVAHYADDSTLYMIECSFEINFELGTKDNCLCANKFFFNISKSLFCMLSNIRYNNSSVLQIRGEVLPPSSHTKFLNTVIDDKMYFSSHITTVCNKFCRNKGFINKLYQFIFKKHYVAYITVSSIFI